MTPDAAGAVPRIVIDTNWVLDLCAFTDPRATALRSAIEERQLTWLVCPRMVSEWERVLDYPALQRAWARGPEVRAQAGAWFKQYAVPVDSAPNCGVVCRDPDDQPFLDLAVAHRAWLLSKDRAVLAGRRRLQALGVSVIDRWPPPK